MQQFVIPQFIDVEDKILGPITVRQFILMIIGGGIVFLLFRILAFTFFLITGVPVAAVTLLFAFVRVNGRPMHYFVVSLIQTLRRPMLRVWNKRDIAASPKMKNKAESTVEPVTPRPPLDRSRLAELSLVVDTGGRYDEKNDAEQPTAKQS